MGPPFLYGDSDTPSHFVAFHDTLGIRRMYSRLKTPGVLMGLQFVPDVPRANIKSNYASTQCTSMALTTLALRHQMTAHWGAVRDLESWLDSGHANHVHFMEDLKFSINSDGRISLEDVPASVPIPVGGESEGDKKILLARAQTYCSGLTGEATRNVLGTLACVYGGGAVLLCYVSA